MPSRPKHLCAHPGCQTLIESGQTYCQAHERRRDQVRGSAVARGYDRRWRRVREAYLAEHPFCECGCGGIAEEVHHIVPIADGGDRFASANLMALTKQCHSRITAQSARGIGGKSSRERQT